jgi:hypothetical protein
MTSLYNRATPRQTKVLKIIEGAVRNAVDAHKNWPIGEPRLPRSIAKRAAGTLTAAWPSVLALPLVASDRGDDYLGIISANVRPPCEPSVDRSGTNRSGDASYRSWRIPVRRIAAAIAYETGQAKRAGNTERAAALIDVLRLLDDVLKRDAPPKPPEKLYFKRAPSLP